MQSVRIYPFVMGEIYLANFIAIYKMALAYSGMRSVFLISSGLVAVPYNNLIKITSEHL